jgi:hypothetical protein
VRLARDGEQILGGICFERYPHSRCGLVTYMVVAPAARERGLGQQLQRGAVRELMARGAPAVFGEIDVPATPVAAKRLARNLKWGAKIVDARYVQPALGPGLARDRQLILIALAGDAPLPDQLPGAVLRDFLGEFYAATEPIDDELAAVLDGIGTTVGLILAHPMGAG